MTIWLHHCGGNNDNDDSGLAASDYNVKLTEENDILGIFNFQFKSS